MCVGRILSGDSSSRHGLKNVVDVDSIFAIRLQAERTEVETLGHAARSIDGESSVSANHNARKDVLRIGLEQVNNDAALRTITTRSG